MSDSNLDIKIIYIDKTAREIFKDRTKIIQKFPGKGIKLMRIIKENKDTTPKEIIKKTGFDEEEVSEMISYMYQENIVNVISLKKSIVKPSKPKIEKKQEEIKIKTEDKKEEIKIKTEDKKEELSSFKQEINKKAEDKKEDSYLDIDLDIDLDIENEDTHVEKKQEDTIFEEIEEEEEEQKIKDIKKENMEKVEKKDMKKVEKKEEEELDDIVLEDIYEDNVEDIAFEEERATKKIEEIQREEKIEDINLFPEEEPEDSMTQTQIKISKRFGEIGLKVLEKIDGKRTISTIAKELKISENMVTDVLNYMKDSGIIKYQNEEKKESKKQMTESMKTPRFEPLAEKKIDKNYIVEKPIELGNEIYIPIDLPRKIKKSSVQTIMIKGKLSVHKNKKLKKVYEEIDGKENFVDLSIKLKIPLGKVDEMMMELAKENLVEFRQVNRFEIENKYGREALDLYKRYGRDGVYLSELIFKKNKGILEIIELSDIDPKKITKIYKFIKEIYGLDLPYDEQKVEEAIKEKEENKN